MSRRTGPGGRGLPRTLGVAVGIVLTVASLGFDARAESPAGIAPADTTVPAAPPSFNPSRMVITPAREQTSQQQDADLEACYTEACADTDWDPYEAYFGLVDAGYAVALAPEDLTAGLICLAAEGAMVGAVADELVAGNRGNGAELGAAIAVASGVIRAEYLRGQDDPAAQRVVGGFERDLGRWNREFAACLRGRGYRASAD